MKAVFLGSIGVIAETSELQRQAYNAAFAEHGLDWYWNVANYCEMLKNPGGVKRINSFSNGLLSADEITAIHSKKEEFFSDFLRQGIAPRPGVSECILKCKQNGIRLGFITTTTSNNIETLSYALKEHLKFTDFDLITTKDDVSAEKPSSDVYGYALNRFGLDADDVIAIEDTEANQAAALHEQILCYLFAGEYATTTYHLNAISSLEILARQI
ncbi:MAG: HAD hydrolase-like protein [Alphaproteobacteria bacterium]|nr:HAD hydrolase-like protein [Alphaproteobacteria bacterium]